MSVYEEFDIIMPMFKGRDEAWLVKDFEAKGWPSAAARENEMSDPNGWQDIATAPKDGSVVDLWARRVETDKYARVTGCSWGEMNDWLGNETEGWTGLYLHMHHTYDEPTHWRHPPPPPDPGYWERRQALKERRDVP